tara:strand:- start:136 stop:588 length:453 start_codon:yes stop_codon:yes gene_type:complete
MRYLLIILSLVSFIVSDTIEYKDFNGKNKVVKNIKIIEINDLEVHYQKSLGFLGNQTFIIDRKDVIDMLDSEGNQYQEVNNYSESNNQNLQIDKLEEKVKKKKYVGGLFIAIGSGILYDATTNPDIDKIDNIEIAYLLISIGGLLLFFGL